MCAARRQYRARIVHASAVAMLALCGSSIAFAQIDAVAAEGHIARVHARFLDYVGELPDSQALARRAILDGWASTYRDTQATSFVPEALGRLSDEFQAALDAFDQHDAAGVLARIESLRQAPDPFLAANAAYLHVRALIDQGRLEEAEPMLRELLSVPDEQPDAVDADRAAAPAEAADDAEQALAETTEPPEPSAIEYTVCEAHTPFASHLWLMLAFCEARNLRFEAALQTLAAIAARYPHAPEPVRVGAKQLELEIRRREAGTLGEVAVVMDYVADRLEVSDTEERVAQRQQEILDLLDQLIKDEENKEQACRGGQKGGDGKETPKQPKQGRKKSEAPGGAGKIGDLEKAPEADPGEMWGKLPPAEREKILQAIRERYPARYRKIVEQYYRSLAEEK